MRPRLAGGLALAAFGMLAVAGSGSAGPVQAGGTFRVAIPAENIDSIDAAITGVAGTTVIARATCASLTTTPDKPPPAGLRVVPELAVGQPKITNGGKTYTFTIRKGMRFSTGARVGAEDVAHTINRVLRPELKAFAATFLTDVVGARAVLSGKATKASGVRARGNTLIIRLTRPLGDFTARIARSVCVVPRSQPVDPEGAKAPIASPAPYYVAEFVPEQRIVLERNRFYRGSRPHHVDRITVDLAPDSASALAGVERGDYDYAWIATHQYAERALELRRKYGLNKGRFFAVPIPFLRMFVLNTQRPLFRGNAALRRAVNFAVDRKALLRERGPLAGEVTDQYLSPGVPGYRDQRVYPLGGPDLAKARSLARGNLRSGRAVLYTIDNTLGVAQAQIVKANLARIGIRVEVRKFPGPLLFERLARRGEPFDIGWIGWLADLPDPSVLNDLFHGRSAVGTNFSRFDSSRFNALLDRASRLTGAERYREYGRIDVGLARDAAPAIAYAYDYAPTLVSARTGCIVLNPYLDLAAVCLK